MVPLGGIIQWSGSIASIPTGWQICDGTNGTPDLRNKFVIGAGDTHAVDETGGDINHTHFFDDGGHVHANGGTVLGPGSGVITAWDALNNSASATANGTTDPDGELPPFYALAYIQRMV